MLSFPLLQSLKRCRSGIEVDGALQQQHQQQEQQGQKRTCVGTRSLQAPPALQVQLPDQTLMPDELLLPTAGASAAATTVAGGGGFYWPSGFTPRVSYI